MAIIQFNTMKSVIWIIGLYWLFFKTNLTILLGRLKRMFKNAFQRNIYVHHQERLGNCILLYSFIDIDNVGRDGISAFRLRSGDLFLRNCKQTLGKIQLLNNWLRLFWFWYLQMSYQLLLRRSPELFPTILYDYHSVFKRQIDHKRMAGL